MPPFSVVTCRALYLLLSSQEVALSLSSVMVYKCRQSAHLFFCRKSRSLPLHRLLQTTEAGLDRAARGSQTSGFCEDIQISDSVPGRPDFLLGPGEGSRLLRGRCVHCVSSRPARNRQRAHPSGASEWPGESLRFACSFIYIFFSSSTVP